MSNLEQQFWTKELNNSSITITSDFGLVALSMILVSGTGSYVGAFNADGNASTPNTLILGQPITITTDGAPIGGWTITTTGIVSLIGKP